MLHRKRRMPLSLLVLALARRVAFSTPHPLLSSMAPDTRLRRMQVLLTCLPRQFLPRFPQSRPMLRPRASRRTPATLPPRLQLRSAPPPPPLARLRLLQTPPPPLMTPLFRLPPRLPSRRLLPLLGRPARAAATTPFQWHRATTPRLSRLSSPRLPCSTRSTTRTTCSRR